MPRLSVLSALALACAVAACDDHAVTTAPLAPSLSSNSGPSGSTGGSDDPTFVQAAADAPTIANPVVSFWAVKGRNTSAMMYYHRAHGGRDSIPLIEFRVKGNSLVNRVDGTPIADGDSILITMTLVDSVHNVVEFQPSGLVFSAKNPAVLRFSFGNDDQDLNDDGVVNSADQAIMQTFKVWRRETTTDPWFSVPSTVNVSATEVDANIGGFTSYAIAF